MISTVRYVTPGSPSQTSIDTRHVIFYRLILTPFTFHLH